MSFWRGVLVAFIVFAILSVVSPSKSFTSLSDIPLYVPILCSMVSFLVVMLAGELSIENIIYATITGTIFGFGVAVVTYVSSYGIPLIVGTSSLASGFIAYLSALALLNYTD